MSNVELPMLPLLLHEVPPGLVMALDQEGVPTAPLPVGPTAPAARGQFVLYDSRRSVARTLAALLVPGQIAVDVADLRAGFAFDPFEALTNDESRLARWDLEGAVLTERVSRYDKVRVRLRLLAALRQRIEARGGIWVRLAAFPFPYRSAFNFRIDYDEYDEGDTASVLRQVESCAGAFSHFVCAGPWQNRAEVIRRLADWDVGSHGYHHHTYRDGGENRTNIERGIDALINLGIEPRGFAAPFGRWDRELDGVLVDCGVSHSSEFGLAHDDLPFFPFLGGSPSPTDSGRFSDVLQVPVHPVCLGLFLEAGERDPDRIAEYFRRVARAKYDAGMPLFFYGHPTRRLGSYPRLLPELLETARSFGALWMTTMAQFAAWWRMRAATRFSVWRTADGYEALVRTPERHYPLALEVCRDEHVAVLPLEGKSLRFSPEGVVFERRRGGDDLPQPSDAIESRGLRETLRRYVDWETVTPVDEIKTRGPRTLLKKGLRYWRAAR